MHLGFAVFFMGIAPVYLNKEGQDPQELYENAHNRLCPNNKILLDTLGYLKENLIDDNNLALSPDKFKQVLDSTIQYLNSTYGSVDSADKNHASYLQTIVKNFNHREKKEVLRSNSPFGVSPETLKGSIGLQFELPTIKHPDCETLFKAIMNAINAAYLQLNNFCRESGKCYVQSDNSLHIKNDPQNIPHPSSNQLANRSNIIDFLGSYPQNGDVMNLLQNYRPNSGNAVKGNFWPEITNNIPNISSPSAQGNLLNQVLVGKVNNGYQNPDPLTILQSFRPRYIDMIKNHGLPIPKGELQINSGLQENGSLWNLLQHFKTNTSFAVKENLPHSENLVTTVNNGDYSGNWNDLTRNQGLVEVLTVLNQPTGYMTVPGGNYTAPTTFSPPKFNMNPVYSNEATIVVNKNISDLTANIPWDNNLRLNANVQNFPDNINKNLPLQSGLNIPYLEQSMGGLPYYQGNDFNIKLPLNIQTGKYYPNVHEPQLGQNREKYLNRNYYNQMKQYSSNAPINPYLKYPTSNLNMFTEKPISNRQFFNGKQNKLQNPFQYRGMTNIPNNILNVNQLPHYQTGAPISDYTYANPNISKELNDLYRLTMTNGAKLNIAPNKNGIVELTFTLHRPQSFVYKPLYYVKYRLPYQTYKYNVQNILQKRPFLRNGSTKLYQDLLEVANITESSQDLKHLAKEEISNLVVTNGALVKAKVIDESGDRNATVENDIQNILQLASNLNPEEMLNATVKALNQVEGVMNTTVFKTSKPNEGNETFELPVKVLNTRSIRYPQLSSQNFIPIDIND